MSSVKLFAKMLLFLVNTIVFERNIIVRMLLKDKVIFITGSNRGIGKSILTSFAQQGARIIAHSREKNEDFNELINNLESLYEVDIHPIYFDLNDIPKLNDLKKLVFGFNKIDVLVNNAGIFHGGLLQMVKDEEIESIFNTNLISMIRLTRSLIPFLRRSVYPSIVNISSISSFDLQSGDSLYGVSKAAVNALTKTLSKELAPLNIRVNAIAPGIVDTDMARSIEPKAYQRALDRTILHQPISPDDIAKVVLFLASEDSIIINGEIIRCDGGRI
jgi:3-oxoacyl-[acyl-carrier protein] reductase